MMPYSSQISYRCASHAHGLCRGVMYGSGRRQCLCVCHGGIERFPSHIGELYATKELSVIETNRRILEAYRRGKEEKPPYDPDEEEKA